jgi:hypothetical protein
LIQGEVLIAFTESPSSPVSGQHNFAGSRCGLLRLYEEVVEAQGAREAAKLAAGRRDARLVAQEALGAIRGGLQP